MKKLKYRVAQEHARGPPAPELAVSQHLPAQGEKGGSASREAGISGGEAEGPGWVGTGEPRGAAQAAQGHHASQVQRGQLGVSCACGLLPGCWWTGEAQVGR